MPKAPSAETVRERAHHRALATVAAIEKPVRSETELDSAVGLTGEHAVMESASLCICDTPGHADDCPAKAGWQQKLETLKQEEPPLPETQDQEIIETQNETEPPKKRGRGPNKPKEPETEQQPQSLRRGIGEGFLEYQARIPANEWVSNVYGNYIYKCLPNGKKKRIDDQPRLQPITMGDLREIATQNGPGEYYVQFTVKTPNLSSCFETFTFDDAGMGEIGGNKFSKNDPEGIAYSAKVAADITKEAAREGLAMVREERVERNKQPDMTGLLTGLASIIAAVQPKPIEQKPDTFTPILMQMLQNQAADAERRASEARADADRREQAAKAEAERQRDRDEKFWTMMMKQTEAKVDSMTQMTGLFSSFIKVKNEIDDTIGGGPKGWMDVAANVVDGVLQQGPAIVAAMKGAPPQQVMQNPQVQANPQQQMFFDFVARLDRYFQRDKYDGIYLHDMIEIEYGQIYVDIKNMPKETVLEAIKTNGGAFMENPKASEFMAKIVDAIKEPDTMDDIFPEEPEEKEPIVLHGKARKVNGKAKNA